jgi:hypothetical protein
VQTIDPKNRSSTVRDSTRLDTGMLAPPIDRAILELHAQARCDGRTRKLVRNYNFSHRTTYTCDAYYLDCGTTNMRDEEWIKKLDYSVVLTKARNPLSHEDVESHFKGELAKKYYC